jgi:predicted PurR-regulated permease PerM
MDRLTAFEINWRTLWRIALFGLFIVFAYFAREAIGVFCIAVVLSLGLEPVISFLERKKVPRILGVLSTFLMLVFVALVILYLLLPVVMNEFGGFLGNVNAVSKSLFGFGLLPSVESVGGGLQQIFSLFSSGEASLTDAIGIVVKDIVLILSTIVVTFYLILEKDGVERLLRAILPDTYERPILSVFHRFKVKIKRWLGTQLGLSLIMGILVSAGLWLLGVDYPLFLGVVAGVFELVPVIGPILIGFIAFAVAVSNSLTLGIYTVIFFFILQQLENHVLVPIVMGRSMKVHPVVVIVALIAGGRIAGLIGIVLAVPIAVLAQEIFTHFAEKKQVYQKLDL